MLRKRQTGFTILELMVAIIVLVIFLTLAIPSFRTAVQNNRLTSATNGFVTAMQLARSEAVTRRTPVTACGSSDGVKCDAKFTDGWVVFVDATALGSAPPEDVPPGSELRVWPAIDGDATNAGDDPDFIRFIPTGAVDNTTGTTFPITLVLEMPDCSGDNAREIEIAPNGRVSARRVACS